MSRNGVEFLRLTAPWTPHRKPTLMAFHLVMIDQRWWRNRIGSWVRGFRPDLLK